MKVVKRFQNRKVDLHFLSERIKDFFESKGLSVSVVAQQDGFLIIARKSFTERINVKLKGSSSDFTVELATEEGSDASILFGSLTTIFGGGSFFLRGIRSKELLEKFEGEFFRYVEDVCNALHRSCRTSC